MSSHGDEKEIEEKIPSSPNTGLDNFQKTTNNQDTIRFQIGNSLVAGRQFIDDHLHEVRAVNGLVVTGAALYILSKARGVKRFKSVLAIPDADFIAGRALRGKVVGVSNCTSANNVILQVSHAPIVRRLIGIESLPKGKENIEQSTLKVGCYGIDVDGKRATPFLRSALEVHNTPVKLKLMHRDAGSPKIAMCKVSYRPNWKSVNLAHLLVENGLAKVSSSPWPETTWKTCQGTQDAGRVSPTSASKLMVEVMRRDSKEIERLIVLEERARAKGVGMWEDDNESSVESQETQTIWSSIQRIFSRRN